MASLTDLATKCRFAVLEVSDDEDEEKPGVGDKARSSKGADANKATAAKKKRKKKKNRAKNTQVLNNSETAARNEEETEEIEQSLDHDEWDEWLQKDEQGTCRVLTTWHVLCSLCQGNPSLEIAEGVPEESLQLAKLENSSLASPVNDSMYNLWQNPG